MGTHVATRTSVQERRKREVNRKRATAGGIVLAGAALVGLGIRLSSAQRGPDDAAFEYKAEDVAYEQPFQAVHEMEQGPPVQFLTKGGPQPKIAINEIFYDFGSIGPTDVVTREFVIANLGDAPLTISRAYTTCGCTTADFTSAIIPPGKVTLVTLRFDAGFHDTAGQTVRRGIIIENNDPERSTAEIWVEAAVRTDS